MNMGLKITLIVILVLVLIIFVGLVVVTRSQGLDIVSHPRDERPDMEESPEDYNLVSENATVTTEDGLYLYGWFIPGTNGATVMIAHGSPGGRQDGLQEAAYLSQAGFGVLLGSFRAHDECDGELISYGYYEQKDLTAWHGYLKSRPDVDPQKIGLYGESMGGGTGILYTAKTPDIAALATASGFALTQETIETFIQYELDPPKWITPILARFIRFWVERGADFSTQDLDTEAIIGQISPRPILIIHGGKDDKVGPSCGDLLYQAAKEPKELLLIPEAGHVNFEDFQPEVYRQALVDFFTQYLLAE